MDSTHRPPTQHPPYPNLPGIHNAAKSPSQSKGRPAPSSLPDWHAADIHILHLCALPYLVHLSTISLGPDNVEGSRTSIVVYFTVFTDASGFLPRPLLLLLNMSAILYWQILFFPHSSDLIWECIVLATWCNQFHSDTLWEVFLKCESFYQMRKLNSIALAWVQTDTEKYKQDSSLPASPGARMKVHNGTVPKQGRGKKRKRIEKPPEEINTGWPSFQSQLGVMGSHIALSH